MKDKTDRLMIKQILTVYKLTSPKLFVQMLLILLAVFSSGIKVILALLYNKVLGDIYNIRINELIIFAIVAILSIIFSGVALYYSRVLKKKVQQEQGYKLQNLIIDKRNKSSLEELEGQNVGDFLTIITEDTDKLATFFSDVVVSFIQGIVLFIISVVIGFFLSYKLTIIILGSSLLSLIVPNILSKTLEKLQHSTMINEEENQNFLQHNLNAIPLIKTYENEDVVKERYENVYVKYANSLIEKRKQNALMVGVNISSGFTISTIWFMVGAFMISTGDVTLAGFASFLMLSDYFNFPFFRMTSIMSDFFNKNVAYERIQNYNDSMNEVKENKSSVNVEKTNQFCSINSVTFKYKNTDKYQFTNFNEAINQNEKVVLIGASGNGKSTISKIIMGLYKAEKGNIMINFNGKNYCGDEVIKLFSYVPQRNALFNGSVKENILIGNKNGSDEEIIEACKNACAYDFIMKLPNGFDTIVGKSSTYQLSDGQVQRIALARALVKKSEIFVFDEFTSAIDEENEKKIIENLKNIDKTMIFIAHKEEIINCCNRRIVI
ncbi:ABC transporter ATP-binding protein/permease [Clostridium tagluense]|uniref:ABC transporter ATP-binding protein n=1 Tax=Clostridium tagluense TaxID=360422 RepID=UPI001CF58096|nr:ABC transporter ATP-binding protein [Clostridium tagluense]MCB2313241.1 ABC transporter ATP-binding protein/permease [Clostridium tagluense]MCB2318008.1 ABC transporter ATP-binding protein/permease [Clostridium tagluense]MCB2322796.1 ABC transporter ATP-binding protein/permease [Clostridium tagluense]MCB2327792.1 ABC transporter ATP-binding protein/permease [Clostridium tagluense]MCB2332439.1 ABC transporter ATP-binding protein/permease [Clostridium tagluense]